MEHSYCREDIITEFLRVAELLEAWEDANCGECYECDACESLNENTYSINFLSLFFEKSGAGEEASDFYRRARELEEMPSENFKLLGGKVAALVKRPGVRGSLSQGSFDAFEELEG